MPVNGNDEPRKRAGPWSLAASLVEAIDKIVERERKKSGYEELPASHVIEKLLKWGTERYWEEEGEYRRRP